MQGQWVLLRCFPQGFTKQNREAMAAVGPSASAVRGTCRLTAASMPQFPWGVDILLSKAPAENNAAKPTALAWTSWLSMAFGFFVAFLALSMVGRYGGVGMEYRIWWEKVCNGWIDDLVFIGEGTAFEGLG